MSDFKTPPAFDFYAERWTHGTRHMTKVERCDYLDLLCHQWTDDGLPESLDILARLLGYRTGSQVPALVVEKFPIADDGKRRNKRLEEERTKQRERIEKRRDGAKKTNAKRWGERVDSESIASRSATLERVDSESPPTTNHQPPRINPHTPGEGAREATGFTPVVWPDPREYPDLATVRRWATDVMTPVECADKWHAERHAEGWATKNGNRPLNPDPAALRPLFAAYATAWKARDQAARQRTNGHAKPIRPADISDVKATNMREL